MGKAFWTITRNFVLASTVTTRYFSPGCGNGVTNTTGENGSQMDVFSDGVMSAMSIYVGVNSYDASCTFTSRKNGAAGNISVSIGAGLTGLFQDLSNTDTIASGDEYALRFDESATTGSITITSICMTFDANSGVKNFYQSWFSSATASTTGYIPFAGQNNSALYDATESNVDHKVKSNGKFRGLCVNVALNGRAQATTIKSRKNGSDGNLSVSVTGSTTGRFVDSTNEDTVVIDDMYNLALVTGTGTGTITGKTFLIFQPGIPGNLLSPLVSIADSSIVPTIGANLTRYFAPCHFSVATTESGARAYPNLACILSNLSCYVPANSVSATSTLRNRINGSNGNQVVSIAANTTGWFHDTTNSDTITTSDYVTLQLVTGATGTSITIPQIYMYQELPTTVQTQTVQAKARVEVTQSKTLQAKARMEVTQNQSLQAKARLEVTEDQTVQAKARIEDVSEQTIQAKARVKDTSEATIQAKGRIENTTEQTITAKARIKDTSSATIQAKAALSLERTETVDAKARMKTTEDQSVTAKSRIFNTVSQTITAKARLKETSSATIQAKAKVEFIRTETIGAKSRLKVTQAQTLTAKAAIRNLVTRTITAKAKIWGARIGVTVGIKGRNTVIRGARYTESG